MSTGNGDQSEETDEKSPLVEFLTKRGTLEIICVIGDSGASPTEINEKVTISHDTVTHRLRDGEKLYDVWYSELAPHESDYRKLFKLDGVGENVKEQIDEDGMLEAFHQLLPYRQALWDAEENVKEWIEENEDEVQSDFVIGDIGRSDGEAYDQEEDPPIDESTPPAHTQDEDTDGNPE